MKTITSPKLPVAVGPYSQAVESQGFIFCSGQIALDLETGEIISAKITEQAEYILKNIQNFVEEQGLSLLNIVKVTVFLKDMNDFAVMNEVYASFFRDHKPARSAVEVARLPKDARVEIEIIISKTL